MKLPKDVEFILEKIESAGYESFVVGGCVRDQLVNYYHNTNYKIKDYDITTNCSYDKLEEIFKGFSMKTVGKSFGVLIIKMNGVHYEIALYREDGEYKDNRRPSDVKFTNNSKIDCGRRDFSVNSILYSPKTGVIDYFNGIEDIKKLELKFIGNASNRLDEDMLRYMRMYRFATKYRMDYPVIDRCKYNKRLLTISKERIRDEFNKILINDNCVEGLKLMIKDKILQTIIPEFKQVVGFDQNNFHHLKTLDGHILDVVEAVPNDLSLRLASLFHDIGKLYTQTTDEKGFSHYIGHELKSAEICSKWMVEYKYTTKQIKEVNDLISNHMKQYGGIKHKGIKRVINDIGIETTSKLIELFYADRVGKIGETKHIDVIKETFKNIIATNQPVKIRDLDINGNDLITLGFKGKSIGEMLNLLLDKVMENPNINNKQKLIKISKEYIEIKPTMIMLSGIPRSGKSTFIETLPQDYIICSADRFREVVLGEKGNMDSENLIWKIHNAFYLEILNQRKNIVIDNTNMKRKYRKKFIQDAKSKGYRVTGVQFNTPLEVCLKRGKQTNFPSDVLMKFFSNRQPLKYEEEFDNIIIKEGGSDDE
jgi:tRNA nucleotidyltransferase (CCA-adding enzyme)